MWKIVGHPDIVRQIWAMSDTFSKKNWSHFYGPPDGSQRAMFLSVRPSMGVNIFCLKTRFMRFWEGLGCFWRFRFLSVRACVTLYVLNFVGWTCPRVLERSTWNLFRSTMYELKLSTSYFWSTSVCPFVRQNGRNRVTSDFFQSCGLNLS